MIFWSSALDHLTAAQLRSTAFRHEMFIDASTILNLSSPLMDDRAHFAPTELVLI